jgi:hypothetical protein
VAAIQTHAVVQSVLTLRLPLVSRVGDPAVGLEKDSGAEVFFLVPPVGRARGRAAGTQNAFIETVELLALFLCLAVFAALAGVSSE